MAIPFAAPGYGSPPSPCALYGLSHLDPSPVKRTFPLNNNLTSHFFYTPISLNATLVIDPHILSVLALLN